MDRDIGSRCLVLSIYKYPQTEVALWNLKVGSNPALESRIALILQYPESRQVGGWDILVLKGGKIETLVLGEDFVGDDFGCQVQVLFILLPLLSLELLPLVIQASLCEHMSIANSDATMRKLTQMRRCVTLCKGSQHCVKLCFPYINQHVGVGELFESSSLSSLMRRDKTVQHVSAIIVFQDLLVCDGRNSVIIKFVPATILFRFDESEIVAAVKITRVHEDTVELIDMGLGPVGRLIEKFS